MSRARNPDASAAGITASDLDDSEDESDLEV